MPLLIIFLFLILIFILKQKPSIKKKSTFHSSTLHVKDTTMVHADAANFEEGKGKEEVYRRLIEEAEALFLGERNWVC
ncbi:hypothetical protein HYFRA_00014046, partial [Hymenoscyphus fraxineus]